MKVVANVTYERLKQIGIGQGRNSEVYLAEDPQLGGTFVVKEIPKASFTDPTLYFAEAQTMFASANRNVVPIQYACETATHVCLMMPHCANGSLADRIAGGPMPPADAVRVFLRVLNGIGEIHARRFIHFDVKPSNILFDGDDEPLVADFGQSRAMNALGAAQVPAVYPFGVTPEAATGTPVGTVESDIYQCGLSLYRAVNGDPHFNLQKPNTMPDLRHGVANGLFPNRNSFQPHVPKGLRSVIRKALQVSPTDRFGSALEFVDALGQVECPHNWAMSHPATGAIKWRSTPPGRATVEVDLLPDGKRFRVEVHAFGNAKRKIKSTKLWASGLTLVQANGHLKQVFADLHS